MRFFIRFFVPLWLTLNHCIQGIACGLQQSKSTPLSGQHVIVTGLENKLGFDMIRNASGTIVEVSGIAGEMIEWMKSYFNFTYSPLQIRSRIPWDSIEGQPGMVSYLLKGECDILGTGVLTPARLALVDFTVPFFYFSVTFVVPEPGSTLNVLAVTKPFKFSAWLGTLGAMGVVLATIYFGTTYSVVNLKRKKGGQQQDKPGKAQMAFYVLGIPFGQSASCGLEKWMSNRIVIGVWCLSAFLLVNYYTSLLTGFTTAPNPQPLIHSIEDLRYLPDVRIVTDKNGQADSVLSTYPSRFFHGLYERIKSDPESRCPTIQKCTDMVKQGRTVYIGARESLLLKAMKEDYLRTGTCNLKLENEGFMIMRMSWTVQKRSPYLDYLNIGITNLFDYGFLSLWLKQYSPDVHQCLENKRTQPEVIAPLQLKSFTGTFVSLFFGFGVSFVVLIIEMIHFHFSARALS